MKLLVTEKDINVDNGTGREQERGSEKERQRVRQKEKSRETQAEDRP